MDIEETMKFIIKEDRRLRETFGDYEDNEKRLLARTVKLGEETGELCSEILAYSSLQRKEKLEKHSHESLEGEIADVIITTLLLANMTNVDVKKAIKDKIIKIEERYKNKNIL